MRYYSSEKFEIEYDYEAVLLIGNGFDLNLGLKTSYYDFLNSQNFQDLLALKNELAIYLKNRHNLQNWIDIENELKSYSTFHKGNNSNFFMDFKSLSDALMAYLNTISIIIEENSSSYKLIKSISEMTTLIVDFNYTQTINVILEDIEKRGKDLNVDHVKIHGALNESNIIFGVEDKANIYGKDVFLKKSVNKNFQAVDFSDAINTCDNFIIFGHSLGETDYMYFEDYFRKSSMNKGQKNIIIYHYGEDSYYQLFSQIDNLTNKKVTKFKQYNTVKVIDTK